MTVHVELVYMCTYWIWPCNLYTSWPIWIVWLVYIPYQACYLMLCYVMLLLFHERGNPFSWGWYKWGTLEEEGRVKGRRGRVKGRRDGWRGGGDGCQCRAEGGARGVRRTSDIYGLWTSMGYEHGWLMLVEHIVNIYLGYELVKLMKSVIGDQRS